LVYGEIELYRRNVEGTLGGKVSRP
jgi:hypothetical protein